MGDIRRFDVIVVGSALGGVVSAALLAKRGYKVALIDKPRQPGGRSGATERGGYWIDWGHRDGHGYGDLAWRYHHGARAAREVGIELEFKPYGGEYMPIHCLPDGHMFKVDFGEAQGAAGADPSASYRRILEGLGQEVDEDVIAEVADAITRIAAIPDDEAWACIETTVGDWATRNVKSPAARDVIYQMLENACASPAEHASLGRFVFQVRGDARHFEARLGVPLDPEVGGMQGIIMPWLRALKQMGGEVWLGWQPIEILVDNRQVKGVLAIDESSIVQRFEAGAVITDYECWALPELVSPDHLPRDFVDLAKGVQAYKAQVVSWWAGLSRLPRRRSDGQTESHLAWQRIVHGRGPLKRYYGGFHFPSSLSNAAPPGKHLLSLTLPAHGEYRWRNFDEAKRALDLSLTYLHQYYEDLEECIEWSDYQYIPDQVMAWNLKPVRRPPSKVATVTGLYIASATTEGLGSWTDREAEVAIEVADMLTHDLGPAPLGV